MPDPLAAFHWKTHPVAGALVRELLDQVSNLNPSVHQLRDRLLAETGTRLVDWLDHLEVADAPGLAARLTAAGFLPAPESAAAGCHRHGGGCFPAIVLTADGSYAAHLRAESVAEVLQALALTVPIAGAPWAPLRRARLAEGRAELWAVERHGYRGFDVLPVTPERIAAILRHDEAFLIRRRAFADPVDGFAHARSLIEAAIVDLGVDLACERFFAAERQYWQRRNRAARMQRTRQDAFGLGWANHDHHTYRSSRAHFSRMIALFERLGFHCRERFYPGHQAGWGAQVLEQAGTGIVIFADVDMSEEEVRDDFAHQPFPDQPDRALGTVGLWCALHGESFLEAGMHHLEATFDFDAVRPQLERLGIASMPPFTDYPHLRQCFTLGERWSVQPERIARLQAAGLITRAQADQFRLEGAIGSHLELLERNQGFKGFNQAGVDRIIAGTDPRSQSPEVRRSGGPEVSQA
jgi:hypothetical protein